MHFSVSIDGLEGDFGTCISIVNVLDILQSCTIPSMYLGLDNNNAIPSYLYSWHQGLPCVLNMYVNEMLATF